MRRLFRSWVVSSSLVSLGLASRAATHAGDQQPSAAPGGPSSAPAVSAGPSADAGAPTRGLTVKTDGAFAGYTLFAPLNSTTTYLVDLDGKLVHSWPSQHEPGQAVHLLDDGSVLRAARAPNNRHFGGGGIGGRIERIAADGKLLWEFDYADEKHCQHHDIEPLPNGHVLLIAWEKKTRDQAIAAGRDPKQLTRGEIWPDSIIEVEPQGSSGGRIVWEWHLWDHLVQEFDVSKANYGVVAEHPELVDLNYRRTAPRESPAEMNRLRSLGYVGGTEPDEVEERDAGPAFFGPGPGGMDMRADWCHTNSVDYNAKLDQIVLSVHTFNEIWIIDHSTSTQEAAGHRGGRSGKGGDLLYRWGNPRAYGAGGAGDQTLFAQHDARWIPDSFPGAGHLTVFNNGPGRPDGMYSSIVEIALPVDAAGHYRLEPGKAFEPPKPLWEYVATNKTDFFSSHISGAERLPNGNTLICAGEQARIFEVTADGKTVWDYVNPYVERSGPGGRFGPPGAWFGGPRVRDRRPRDAGPGAPPDNAVGPGLPPNPDGVATTRPTQDGGPRAGGRRPTWGWPPGGPPGFGPGGPGGGLFRATRLAADHAGVRRALEAARAKREREDQK